MVYAVQATLGFRNAARRDAVMQNVQTRLASEITWGVTTTRPIDVWPGHPDPSLIVEVRFTTGAARDSFWADVIAFMGTGLNGPVVGSWISQHDCPHDGELQSCVESQRVNY